MRIFQYSLVDRSSELLSAPISSLCPAFSQAYSFSTLDRHRPSKVKVVAHSSQARGSREDVSAEAGSSSASPLPRRSIGSAPETPCLMCSHCRNPFSATAHVLRRPFSLARVQAQARASLKATRKKDPEERDTSNIGKAMPRP